MGEERLIFSSIYFAEAALSSFTVEVSVFPPKSDRFPERLIFKTLPCKRKGDPIPHTIRLHALRDRVRFHERLSPVHDPAPQLLEVQLLLLRQELLINHAVLIHNIKAKIISSIRSRRRRVGSRSVASRSRAARRHQRLLRRGARGAKQRQRRGVPTPWAHCAPTAAPSSTTAAAAAPRTSPSPVRPWRSLCAKSL